MYSTRSVHQMVDINAVHSNEVVPTALQRVSECWSNSAAATASSRAAATAAAATAATAAAATAAANRWAHTVASESSHSRSTIAQQHRCCCVTERALVLFACL